MVSDQPDAQRKYVLTVSGEKLHLEHCLENALTRDLRTVQARLDENAAREQGILDQLHVMFLCKK